MKRRNNWHLIVACLASTLAANAAFAQDDFFKGKTVTYIVATGPGGAFDGYARLTARYMEKYLPGSSFVVVNRPGAGHLIGANMIYAAKPDGLTLGTFNIGVMYSQLLGQKTAQYDLGKMSWIGKAATDKRVIMVGTNTPYKTFQDLRDAKTPVTIAISGVGTGAYTELLMLGKVFDINFKLLAGYNGNEDDMAVMRGEAVGKMSVMSGAETMVRTGRGRFVIQIGGARETGYGEMSYYEDVIQTLDQRAVMSLIASQSELFRITVGPPGIPVDRLEVLRNAYRKSFADSALLADADKLHYAIDPLVGVDMEKVIHAALAQPPHIIALLKESQSPNTESSDKPQP